MPPQLSLLFDAHGDVLTTAQLTAVVSRSVLRRLVRQGKLTPLWHGLYCRCEPTVATKLAGLDVLYGVPVVPALGTAAGIHGFDTERTSAIHILDPRNRHVHGYGGLVVHQRLGAPLVNVEGRLVTAPAWTAVEVARELPRPRSLATLDAALHVGACTLVDLRIAADEQSGRRGICHVRELIEVADGGADSPMESEARLVLLDAGLPRPTLQLPILDRSGYARYFLDFGWEEALLGGEYDSDEFHSGPLALRRDRARIGWLQDQGWLIVPITADDVRRRPDELVARFRRHLIARLPAA
ncbi:type IV toxin-antitoxin system AbiEi family antitoxin domain-containing protein [Skermania sp. ID1734]|nr:type IV toxin-antitoxin system AbiEi family antitoxin domain-containing protein [Skermania sp. ID1734]